MPEIPDVVAGQDVLDTWGNQTRDRVTMRYTTVAALNASEPGAIDGSLRWTDEVGLVFRLAGVWIEVASADDLAALEVQLQAEIAAATDPGPWQLPTLLNGWTNFGAGEEVARYRFEQGGTIVRSSGLVEGGVATVNTPIFILAAGYRPLQNLQQAVTSNNAYGQVKVRSDGNFLFRAGSNANLSLDFTWAVDS